MRQKIVTLEQALVNAIKKGQRDLVDQLLAQGANIHTQDEEGATPLMWAARDGNQDIVGRLLEQGANINAQNHDGWTALMFAARADHLNIVTCLIKHGADIHVKNNDDITALRLAVWYFHREIACLLLEHGARVDAMNLYDFLSDMEMGDTEFSNEISQGHIEVAEVLWRQNPAWLNQSNQYGQTPLIRAVIYGKLGAVRWLIAHGADLHAESRAGLTALYSAASALLAHQHDEEKQKLYQEMLMTIAQAYPSGEAFDAHTQALIACHAVLDELLNPGGFILK